MALFECGGKTINISVDMFQNLIGYSSYFPTEIGKHYILLMHAQNASAISPAITGATKVNTPRTISTLSSGGSLMVCEIEATATQVRPDQNYVYNYTLIEC